MRRFKFVSYTGRYPCLCMGTLTLEIDGKPYTFHYENGDYKPFWASSGEVYKDETGDWIATDGPWVLDPTYDTLAHFTQEEVDEMLRIFNENVPQGCCGGCI